MAEMGRPAEVTLTVTVIVALLGFLATYLNNIAMARRQARLDRLTRQLSEFYGPLYSIVRISGILFLGFKNRHIERFGSWRVGGFGSPDAAAHFHAWMKEVFLPLNERIVEILLTRSDLLEETDIPDVLLTAAANAWGWKPILSRWEQGDLGDVDSIMPYPHEELAAYSEKAFLTVKREHRELLGKRRGT
jgi:hypothetical protein